MFFFLSKTLNYLVMPFTLVCLCLFISVVLKNDRWKKRFFWVGFSLLFFFSNDFIANEIMTTWEPEPVAYKAITMPYEWGIVLTGATAPPRQPNDRVYFTRGADRVTHSVQLYKLGLIKNILITGGSGSLLDNRQKEADEFKSAMILMGVPAEDILVESESRNTHESAVAVKKIADSLKIDPGRCVLITSAFHMRRSIACFRKVNLKMAIFTTDFYAHKRMFTPDVLFIPKLDAMSLWQKLIREWVGITTYWLAGYV